MMNWTRSETLALAEQRCVHCWGLGLRQGRGDTTSPCHCVMRAIFRACYDRFRQCSAKEKYISRVSLEANPGRQRKSVWGMKNEEFIADFCLVARRTLTPAQHTLFKFHYLLGAEWPLCSRKLGIERGVFFHECYRIESKLGRAFRELVPYALFPLDEYFNGCGRQYPPAAETSRARRAPALASGARSAAARRADRVRLQPPISIAAA
jgi:hypothetical protein